MGSLCGLFFLPAAAAVLPRAEAVFLAAPAEDREVRREEGRPAPVILEAADRFAAVPEEEALPVLLFRFFGAAESAAAFLVVFGFLF